MKAPVVWPESIGPLVRWAGWVKAGILAGLTKMESDTLAVIAAHEGEDGSYPSVPTIARLTRHKASRLYGVLRKLVTLGALERVGSVRYARSRGSAVVVYRVTKPPTLRETSQGKASPSGDRKPPHQRPESLPRSGGQSDLKRVKELAELCSAPPPDAAPLRAPQSGGLPTGGPRDAWKGNGDGKGEPTPPGPEGRKSRLAAMLNVDSAALPGAIELVKTLPATDDEIQEALAELSRRRGQRR